MDFIQISIIHDNTCKLIHKKNVIKKLPQNPKISYNTEYNISLHCNSFIPLLMLIIDTMYSFTCIHVFMEPLSHGLIGREKPMASSLSTDGFPLMAGPNFQPSDGNPTVISILRQLADGPENVPEM